MAENSEEPRWSTRNSIYRAARSIKRRDNSLYKAFDQSIETLSLSDLTTDHDGDSIRQLLDKWDCSLHLPLWASKTERASIEARLDEWTSQLDESGADIASLALCLRKPLRPLWVSQKTVIWLNEVPDHDSWDFTLLILVSSSASEEIQSRTNSEFSLNYIPGAGDDEESWARGLSPNVFWKHDLIDSGSDLCNQKVAEVVEIGRVY